MSNYINKEEKQVLDIFQELLNKYDSQGVHEARDGHTRVSVFGRQCRFDLSKSFPLFTHRQHFMRGVFEEVMWYIRGQTDNQILKDKGFHVWNLWEGIIDPDKPTELGTIYGAMFRRFGETPERKGFDQINWLLNEIKTNPSSSRLILSNWNPVVSCNTPKEAVLPCCLTLLQFHVEEMSDKERVAQATKEYGHDRLIDLYAEHVKSIVSERALDPKDVQDLLDSLNYPKAKLSCILHQRSSDCSVSSGWNCAQFALLTTLIAQQCDLSLGEFIWNTGNIHLYGDQIDDVREMVKRPTHPFPQIKINKAKDLYSYEWSDIEIINYQHSGKMENLKVAT